MLPDMLLMFSVIVSVAPGLLLGTIVGQVAWWRRWTDDE